jgi:hypothetical protein
MILNLLKLIPRFNITLGKNPNGVFSNLKTSPKTIWKNKKIRIHHFIKGERSLAPLDETNSEAVIITAMWT